MILPMVNEAARCLAERIVDGPGALDLAMVFGIGFPPFRGGLCRWADSEGLPTIVAPARGARRARAARASRRATPCENSPLAEASTPSASTAPDVSSPTPAATAALFFG